MAKTQRDDQVYGTYEQEVSCFYKTSVCISAS